MSLDTAQDPVTGSFAASKRQFEAEGGRARRAPRARAAGPAAWLKECQHDAHGQPHPNLVNALVALRADPALCEHVRFDEMQRGALICGPLPGQAPAGGFPRPLRDTDATAVQEYLQRSGLPRIGRETVYQALEARAVERGFHPVRDYLSSLRWDRRERLRTWLTDYLGAKATDYTAGIAPMILTSMVARVRRPGCKADYMPVLVGKQGCGKSSALRILGGRWFSDALPDIRSGGKDVSMHLRGRWLIEVAELSALDRVEAAALKAFITRAEERYRPSYGRAEVEEPRQCILIGTTNKAQFLRDETGGRRFWPIEVGTIRLEHLARDRDQLFAEADHLFGRGAPWWPTTTFEREHIAPVQEERHEADAWEQAISAHLAGTVRTTILDVARSALSMEAQRVGTFEQRRIAAALERLGWSRRPSNGVRWWVKQ